MRSCPTGFRNGEPGQIRKEAALSYYWNACGVAGLSKGEGSFFSGIFIDVESVCPFLVSFFGFWRKVLILLFGILNIKSLGWFSDNARFLLQSKFEKKRSEM